MIEVCEGVATDGILDKCVYEEGKDCTTQSVLLGRFGQRGEGADVLEPTCCRFKNVDDLPMNDKNPRRPNFRFDQLKKWGVDAQE
jgi:hypothetical protein